MHNYRDVSGDAAAREAAAFPEVVRAFEDLGCEVCGWMLMDVDDVVGISEGYLEPDRSWFVDNARAPATVLCTPNHDAFIEISAWFGDTPSVRVRSWLDDGALVETQRAWDRLATLNPEHHPYGHLNSKRRQQMRGHAPGRGRSKRLVEGDDWAALLQAHEAHLADMCARRDTVVGVHRDIGGAIQLTDVAYQHGVNIVHATGPVGMWFIAALGLFGLAIVPVMWAWQVPGIVMVLVVLGIGWFVADQGPGIAMKLAQRWVWVAPPDFVPPSKRTRRLRLVGRAVRDLVAVSALVVLYAGTALVGHLVVMPGESHEGPPPAPNEALQDLATQLEDDVRFLSETIGERNLSNAPDALERTASWIEQQWETEGWDVQRHEYVAGGHTVRNLYIDVPGSIPETVVVGAHYDSAPGTPGADDNASGVAALLALSDRLRDAKLHRRLRLVAFVNEEPPWFKGPGMGSLVYAWHAAGEGDQLVGMFSLETLGYYRDEPGSQRYPAPFSLLYPSRGDFVAFVGDVGSRTLVRQSVEDFRERALIPSEGGALPRQIPGVSWSDHWSFWMIGVPAVMITDTAPNRNPHYHRATDTADHLDFGRLARVVDRLDVVVRRAAGPDRGDWMSWLVFGFGSIALALGYGSVQILRLAALGQQEAEEVLAAEPRIEHLGAKGPVIAEALRAGNLDALIEHTAEMTRADRTAWIETLAELAPIAMLDMWCEAEPGNALAFFVRAQARVGWAWRARGNGWAHEVSPARWRQFYEHLDQAWLDFQTAASLDPTDPEPWVGLMSIARVGKGNQTVDELFDEALAREPLHFGAYRELMTARMSRWGGSHMQMFALARAARADAPPGSPLHALIAAAHLERHDRYFDEEEDDYLDDESEDYFLSDVVVRELESAMNALEAGFDLGQDARWSWERLALAFERAGDEHKARLCWDHYEMAGSDH